MHVLLLLMLIDMIWKPGISHSDRVRRQRRYRSR